MAIAASGGKMLMEPHPIVHSKVDDFAFEQEVMINNGDMESKPIKFKKNYVRRDLLRRNHLN